ncbi:hypothetical protein, partial [Peribacillus simplex]|uniref:hypothetical protein n=1 Tax=Peribacillus simplex TaxID=1478 RepID=UPI003338E865
GRAVSLLGVNACGVSPVPLLPQESRTSAPINLKSFCFKNNNLYEKSLFCKENWIFSCFMNTFTLEWEQISL